MSKFVINNKNMNRYIFYRSFDEAKEAIGEGRFASLEEAVMLFAKKKKLTIPQFKSMFKVEGK